MSARRRLLCSLPLVTLTLLAICPAARGASDAPNKLVDVNDQSLPPTTLLLGDEPGEQNWTLVWTDLGITEGDAPPPGAGGTESMARTSGVSGQVPAVIAAPLPPALLPGLIGLATVYFCRRRLRLR